MNTAWVSGQSGVAIITASRPSLMRVEETEVVEASASTIANVFRSATDFEKVGFATRNDLRARLVLAWRQDRALRFFIQAWDSREEVDGEWLEMLEEMLAMPRVDQRIRNEFYARSLPASFVARELQGNSSRTLTEAIQEHQPHILRVERALQALPISLFDSNGERDRATETLISRGLARRAAEGLARNDSADSIYFDLLSGLSDYPNGRQIATELKSALLGKQRSRGLSPQLEEPEADETFYDEVHQPNHLAFRNALDQQAGVVAKLREGNVGLAILFADQLVESQRKNSTPIQISKSLCRLSQEAKKLGHIELQLRWAEGAALVAPDDPFAHGQRADALIGLHRYGEAELALQRCEEYGDPHYAGCGRARILRATGHYEDAIALLDEVKKLPGVDEEKHIPWSLRAEVLHELGRHDQALDEYRRGLQRYPDANVLHCGLAAMLGDVGRFAEADAAYRSVLERIPLDRVARHGRATIRKLAGELSMALAMYDELVAENGHDPVALCARADVLRLMGKPNSAEEQYDSVIARFPKLATAYCAKAQVLLELKRFDHAYRMFDRGRKEFPHDPQFQVGVGYVHLAKGRADAAHRVFESVSREFPYFSEAKFGTASALRRLGRYDDSLRQYDRLIAAGGVSKRIATGIASTRLCQDRPLEALTYLPTTYRTMEDWYGFVLRLLAQSRVTGLESAIQLFNEHHDKIPFARCSKLARSYMARVEVEMNRAANALNLVDRHSRGAAEIIYFHVLAAMQNRKAAEELLRKINQSGRPIVEKKVAREIAAHYKIVDLRPQKSREWILHQEQTLLAFEAAS